MKIEKKNNGRRKKNIQTKKQKERKVEVEGRRKIKDFQNKIKDIVRCNTLYSNIKHNEGISALEECLSNKRTKNTPRSNNNSNEMNIKEF